MNEELIRMIEDYVVPLVPDMETKEQAQQELIDAYESMQDFTELDDGEFIMVTGNSEDEVSKWLASDEASSIVRRVVDEKTKDLKLDSHEKMIILTPDDDLKLADYTNFRSLQQAVNGNIEYCFTLDLPVDPVICGGKTSIPCDLYCNEEFLIRDDDEFNKVNAVASLLMTKESSLAEIRGNVVILPSTEEGGNRGFQYSETINSGKVEENLCECWSAEDVLINFINKNSEMLDKFHERFDNNKSDPKIEFIIE